MAVTRLATSRGTSSPAGTRGSSWRRPAGDGHLRAGGRRPGLLRRPTSFSADASPPRAGVEGVPHEGEPVVGGGKRAAGELAVVSGKRVRHDRVRLATNATSTEARRCRRRSRRGSRLPRPAGGGYSRSGSMPSSGQRSRKSRSASAIWRSTIGVRTAPRAGSLASADRPSGVAAKDASACSSLASKRSTIAILA